MGFLGFLLSMSKNFSQDFNQNVGVFKMTMDQHPAPPRPRKENGHETLIAQQIDLNYAALREDFLEENRVRRNFFCAGLYCMVLLVGTLFTAIGYLYDFPPFYFVLWSSLVCASQICLPSLCAGWLNRAMPEKYKNQC